MEYSQTTKIFIIMKAQDCLNPYSNGILTDTDC